MIILAPAFLLYRKRVILYFLAIAQHSLIGDYLAGGKIQLLWPVTTTQYGIELGIKNPVNITIELIAFTISFLLMLKTGDIRKLFHSEKTILLIIPICSLISPILLKFPIDVPLPLILPHIVFTILFVLPIFIKLKSLLSIRSK